MSPLSVTWVSSGMIDQRNTFIGDVSAGTKTQNSLSSCLACMQILQQQKPHFNMRAEEVIEGETFHRVLVDSDSALRCQQIQIISAAVKFSGYLLDTVAGNQPGAAHVRYSRIHFWFA